MSAFNVGYDYTDDGQLTVDFPLGSVIITYNEDGVSVDIYPLHPSDGPAASCYAVKADLESDEEDSFIV